MWGDAATPTTFDGGTIGGNAAATEVAADGNIQGNCAIMSLLVPAGTTATIAFSVDGATVDRGAIAVYRALNETVATAHDTATDDTISSGVLITTIDIPVNGWVIGVATPSAAVSPTTDTWVGVTEDFGGAYGDAAGIFRSGRHDSLLAVQTGRTVQCTFAVGTPATSGRLAALSWG